MTPRGRANKPWQTYTCRGSVGCASDWSPGGPGFDPRRGRQHSFVEIDHEIFSTVVISLPLIQEGQLSVSGERMCTILVSRLEDPVNVWLGKLTALDMTPLGWLGRKTSTSKQTCRKSEKSKAPSPSFTTKWSQSQKVRFCLSFLNICMYNRHVLFQRWFTHKAPSNCYLRRHLLL